MEAGTGGIGSNRHECAADVGDPVEPSVGNVEGDENSARAENPKAFGKELILEPRRSDVVQDEDGED